MPDFALESTDLVKRPFNSDLNFIRNLPGSIASGLIDEKLTGGLGYTF
jgi:hypothetical protein